MADVTNPQITDSVSSTNLKNLGDNPTLHNAIGIQNALAAQQLAQQNLLAHQNRMNVLAETAVASAIRSVSVTPQEEASAGATEKGGDQPAQITALLSALSAGQMGAKTAMTTPPQTGNDLSVVMSQLGSVVATLQQMMKGAQSTPPETAVPRG